MGVRRMKRRDLLELIAGALLAICTAAAPAFAQDSDEELQKKLANPVADLISVPFQYTGNLNVGPLDKTQHILNIQPVYPMKLDGGWSLIHRAIVPLMSMPAFTPDQDRKNGMGDIVYEGFFAPTTKPGELIWGAGPAIQLKTATDERLGSGKWAAGPAVVALEQSGKWSVGALVTQLWSFAGDDSRPDISQFQLQPLATYRLSGRNTIGYLGTITANWKEDRSSQRWSVPLGLSYSILTRPAGMSPVNLIFGGGYNVIRPDDAGNWFVRFQVNFVFPK
jgi:hypothetical protein